MTRIAVLNEDKCKVKKCNQICVSFCPMVRSRVEAIRVEGNKAIIVETLCSGCGICVKKCPFKAISIVNLPDELEKDCSHRFGANSFKLFRLPMPSPGTVLGLLGQNGIGKTTTLKVFSGDIKPNLGKYDNPPDWQEIIQYYRGSSLQDYFQKMSEKKLKISSKPQYVDKIPKAITGKSTTSGPRNTGRPAILWCTQSATKARRKRWRFTGCTTPCRSLSPTRGRRLRSRRG